jgi:hypothetical protein
VSIKEQLKETLGHMTDKNQELAVFANNVVFGISRYKNGIIDDKTRGLLQQGEELCTVLRRGADMFRKPHPEPYSIAKSDLNSLLTFEFLSEFFKENEQNVPFSLDNLVEKATEEQSVLEKLLHERPTEESNKTVDECQDFFASLGSIFVRLANDGLRQREKSERIHYV